MKMSSMRKEEVVEVGEAVEGAEVEEVETMKGAAEVEVTREAETEGEVG
jgi:hypothetical protein